MDIIRKKIRKILNEYVSNPIISLKHYLSMTDDEKKESLVDKYSYLVDEFLIDNDFMDDLDDRVDGMESYEIAEYLRENNPDILSQFGQYILDGIEDHNIEIPDEEYPSWAYMSNPKIIKNQWLIHFTDDADSIMDSGFKYGVFDISRLGLTNLVSDNEKKFGGYNFAYLINDFQKHGYERGGKYKYGSEAVLFKASGVRIYHSGDEEPQVIFFGNTANNIISITSGNEYDWAIRSKKTGNSLYENNDLDNVVDWVIKNFDTYRKHF